MSKIGHRLCRKLIYCKNKLSPRNWSGFEATTHQMGLSVPHKNFVWSLRAPENKCYFLGCQKNFIRCQYLVVELLFEVLNTIQ